MTSLPLHRRNFHTFLSHAHADRAEPYAAVYHTAHFWRIEAGIALGARRTLHYYYDDAQLIGIPHKLVHPYRRRVLNGELPRL